MAADHGRKRKHAEAEAEPVEYFPGIGKIPYDPSAAADNCLVFKHYNAKEVVLGRTQEDWLRFSVCFWHTFRGGGADPFGGPTLRRPWQMDGLDNMVNAKARLRAAFEFFTKLGVKYYTFHDMDIAPAGATWEETCRNIDEVAELALQLQNETGMKLLWGTANLFSATKYANGAATNPDAHVFACAAAQVKKAIEVTHKLGGENYVFWGGREGYASLLNTNVRRELDHLAAFFRMAVAHAQKIGFTGQFLIEPKPKEPTRHQYDYDAQTVIGFLKTYGLDAHFKLNIEPNHTTLAGHCFEHDVTVASQLGFLGSIDSNTGSGDLGWDTDQFPMNLKDCTMIMKAVIEQGGIAPGGLNFDAKVRRESSELADIFIAHIGAMDTFARALKAAAALNASGVLSRNLKERYASYDEGLGKRIEDGTATFEDCDAYVRAHGDPRQISGKQEMCESVVNHFTYPAAGL